MNYFSHVSSFYNLIEDDDRLTAHHVSLYMGLFQLWNRNRFKVPITIYRDYLMSMSKIGSTHTYYKCIKELHHWGYIEYLPTNSKEYTSKVKMFIFDAIRVSIILSFRSKNATDKAHIVHHIRSNSDTDGTHIEHHSCSINDIDDAHVVHPYIDIIDNNRNRLRKTGEKKNIIEKKIDGNYEIKHDVAEKRKKVPAKKEKIFMNPNEQIVIDFFQSEKSNDFEAKKFFNHYTANGWKIGGRTPMVNWQASARKWILESKPQNVKKLNQDKNYNEPL